VNGNVLYSLTCLKHLTRQPLQQHNLFNMLKHFNVFKRELVGVIVSNSRFEVEFHCRREVER